MPTYATNRKARYDYHIEKKFEAGIMLDGGEVKSIRAGQVNLRDSYVKFNRDDELWLINAHVSPWQHGPHVKHDDPTRRRKLLLHKRELERLKLESAAKGLTMIPLSLYSSHGLIKLEFALARGKQNIDRKQDKKERDIERDTRKQLKSFGF